VSNISHNGRHVHPPLGVRDVRRADAAGHRRGLDRAVRLAQRIGEIGDELLRAAELAEVRACLNKGEPPEKSSGKHTHKNTE